MFGCGTAAGDFRSLCSGWLSDGLYPKKEPDDRRCSVFSETGKLPLSRRIDSGLQADIALFKLDELRHSGHDDPLAALVQCGAHRADRVMIAGQWQVENGRASHIDEVDLVARHSALARRLRNRAGLE